MSPYPTAISVSIVTDDTAVTLDGVLDIPPDPTGVVIFAHGRGSNRMSPRNISVARQLNAAGIATLLFDLLTDAEASSPHHGQDIALLANRVQHALDWTAINTQTAPLPKGLFGAGTGAAAALETAARGWGRVEALVARGGYPDLAQAALPRVSAPTLQIVAEMDRNMLDMGRMAKAMLGRDSALRVVPGASALFEEPGALDMVGRHSVEWFTTHLRGSR